MNDPALILIVEDNAGSLELATVSLEFEGFSVIGAESAEEARRMLRVNQPDLILMDIQLPGMDGLQFTRELKADPKTAPVPVIALTAHAMPLHERAARAAGCDGFIPKPWTPEALSREVRAFLGASPGARA
jgi:two-component system cell cycle response regulator DivK